MDTETPSPVDRKTLTTPILPEEALERLAPFEPPHRPVFYEVGIADDGASYYQLATIDDKRILLFARNLEELQQREYPGFGKLFANPVSLEPVNVYEKSASTGQIFADLVAHQAKEAAKMRGYTLVHTAPDIYQSPAVSYALRHSGGTAAEDKVAVDAFINSLHNKDYAPAAVAAGGPLYDRMQVSRITIGDGLEPRRAAFVILDHFSRHLNKLAQGGDGIDGEDARLNIGTRAALHSKMYGVRLFDKLTRWFGRKTRELTEEPAGLLEIVERIGAVLELFTPEGGPMKFVVSLWHAFGFVPEKPKVEIPEPLQPYVTANLSPGLGSSYRLTPEAMEKLVPLTMAEADFAPPDCPIVPGSPFEATTDRAPDMGALRVPMGTILHAYPHVTLLMQANGVWMAMHHQKDKLYVGYNKEMDTEDKPNPSPILNAWLDAGKVLCYSRAADGHSRKAARMEWADAAQDLQEIIARGEAHLLAAHKPEHKSGPHVIPGPKAVNNELNLNFAEALRLNDEKSRQFAAAKTAATTAVEMPRGTLTTIPPRLPAPPPLRPALGEHLAA